MLSTSPGGLIAPVWRNLHFPLPDIPLLLQRRLAPRPLYTTFIPGFQQRTFPPLPILSASGSAQVAVASPSLLIPAGLGRRYTRSMDPDVFGAPLPNPIGNFSAQAMDAALDQFKFGSAAIASISALSALMVGFLIIQLIVVTFCPKGRKKGEDGTPIYVERAFLKTHLGMYVFCLLVTNLASALGGILQAAWAIRTAMGQDLQQSGAMSALLWDFGTCQAQGWLTQIGDVGSAIWTVVMGLHSFRTLVLHRYLTFRGVAIALVIGWFLTFFFAFAGPLIALGNGASFYGPVFAEDGPLWCWTYYPYAQFQFWFNSLFTLLSALSSVVLYTLTFVILRYRRKGGDGVVKYGGCFSPRYEAWLWIAVKKMLAYPLGTSGPTVQCPA
ncbi:hypothetical protein CALVIDRAFT_366610 [Calocera viscosa TUFC12733]|uniref:Glucose receptor Git3 N-terminal domain-containing protein n=1 Tax=Calocera viscosa (strain TUFC12733) TaxID=1330018 RepID=A0A167H0Y1_CALVF|nr:hypothetical protein CALVIDRAFT_366610 [Calocera viscosa TUFC12733]